MYSIKKSHQLCTSFSDTSAADGSPRDKVFQYRHTHRLGCSALPKTKPYRVCQTIHKHSWIQGLPACSPWTRGHSRYHRKISPCCCWVKQQRGPSSHPPTSDPKWVNSTQSYKVADHCSNTSRLQWKTYGPLMQQTPEGQNHRIIGLEGTSCSG